MHAADVMDVAGDHARAVGSDDAAQRGHRQVRAMFGPQSGRAQPAVAGAAVAGDVQHRETGATWPSRTTPAGMGQIFVEHVAAPLRYAVTLSRLSPGGWPAAYSANRPPAQCISRGAPWRPKLSLASWLIPAH